MPLRECTEREHYIAKCCYLCRASITISAVQEYPPCDWHIETHVGRQRKFHDNLRQIMLNKENKETKQVTLTFDIIIIIDS